uniref:F-box/LRR-repeat protein 3-like n=1 Tax=Rhizophora mucronata TaxID=61149 RepID=A0A2P2PM55_RHIMU
MSTKFLQFKAKLANPLCEKNLERERSMDLRESPQVLDITDRELSSTRGQRVRSMWPTCGYLSRILERCSWRRGLRDFRCLDSVTLNVLQTKEKDFLSSGLASRKSRIVKMISSVRRPKRLLSSLLISMIFRLFIALGFQTTT